jgi:hypothetical protein
VQRALQRDAQLNSEHAALRARLRKSVAAMFRFAASCDGAPAAAVNEAECLPREAP